MRLRVAVFGTLGILATLLGVVIIFNPSLVETGPLQSIEQWGAQRTVAELLFLIGLGVLVYLLVAARSGDERYRETTPERRFGQIQSSPPELVTAEKHQLAAATLDRNFSYAVEYGGAHFQQARDLLYQTAVTSYADATNVTPAVAQEQIEHGQWTTDTTAATVLAGPEGPQPSLPARLHLWLRPERERERRLTRTVDAIVRTQEPGYR